MRRTASFATPQIIWHYVYIQLERISRYSRKLIVAEGLIIRTLLPSHPKNSLATATARSHKATISVRLAKTEKSNA
jgi:hypothetical protein